MSEQKLKEAVAIYEKANGRAACIDEREWFEAGFTFGVAAAGGEIAKLERRLAESDEERRTRWNARLAAAQAAGEPIPRDPVWPFYCDRNWLDGLTPSPAGAPAGWKLVPMEPTEDMVLAGLNSRPDRFFQGDNYPTEFDDMSGCQQAAFKARRGYAAMLAVAPPPPAHAQQQVGIEPKCKTCGGAGIVDDGEIDYYPNGEPYMHGPVKCVKDCPDCAAPVPPAQAQQLDGTPFMYGIMSPDGAPYFNENCISDDEGVVEHEVNCLNDSPDTGYKVVGLYLAQPQQQAGALTVGTGTAIRPDVALKTCWAGRDGECRHLRCPQLLDGEPQKSGRHCPLDNDDGSDQ